MAIIQLDNVIVIVFLADFGQISLSGDLDKMSAMGKCILYASFKFHKLRNCRPSLFFQQKIPKQPKFGGDGIYSRAGMG